MHLPRSPHERHFYDVCSKSALPPKVTADILNRQLRAYIVAKVFLAFGREILIQDRARTSNNDSKQSTLRFDCYKFRRPPRDRRGWCRCRLAMRRAPLRCLRWRRTSIGKPGRIKNACCPRRVLADARMTRVNSRFDWQLGSFAVDPPQQPRRYTASMTSRRRGLRMDRSLSRCVIARAAVP
jgi:hypothetical protein